MVFFLISIQEMAKSCVAIGIKSLCGDCCRYIKEGSEVLRQKAKLLQECCQSKMSNKSTSPVCNCDYLQLLPPSLIVAQEEEYEATLKAQKRLTQQLEDLEGTLKFAESNRVFKELKESYEKDKKVGVMIYTRYTHAHHVPHAEHVESSKWRSSKRCRDDTVLSSAYPVAWVSERSK